MWKAFKEWCKKRRNDKLRQLRAESAILKRRILDLQEQNSIMRNRHARAKGTLYKIEEFINVTLWDDDPMGKFSFKNGDKLFTSFRSRHNRKK